MISIYTDTSVSTQIAAVTHVVLSEDTFIGYNYLIVPNVYRSYVGELVGIREGLRYYISLNKEPTMVTVYTDSDKALELLAMGPDRLVGVNKKLVMQINKLCKKCNATVEHYVGHQVKQNANKISDHISRSVLRGALRRGEVYEQVKI